MIAYKLLDQELRSNNGQFQWEMGKEYTIEKPGNEMCSDEVFHCYNHPALAVLFNVLHADIQNPRLFEIEVPEFVNDDKLKYASKSQKLIKEIDLPVISINQRIEFAIKVAKIVCKDEAWNAWADKWLSGEDRSEESANAAAANAANATAWNSAAAAAYNAADAADAADAAVYYTANAAYNAYADAVADAVSNSAAWAVDAARIRIANDDFIRIIEEIMNR